MPEVEAFVTVALSSCGVSLSLQVRGREQALEEGYGCSEGDGPRPLDHAREPGPLAWRQVPILTGHTYSCFDGMRRIHSSLATLMLTSEP